MKPRPRASGMWRHVADLLQRDIIFGRLQPREHLIEDEIMERIDTSRHAVRRAFDEMERNGLIVREPNRGARVRSYTPNEVEDLYEVREILESKAVFRIKLPAPDALIKRLSTIQKSHERASGRGDVVEVFEANNLFHETFYQACGNEALAEAIRLYAMQTHPIRMRLMSDTAWRKKVVQQHWQMIEFLSRADRKALAALCLNHILPPKDFYLSMYRNLGQGRR